MRQLRQLLWSYALDGHEAGQASGAVLAKYSQHIAPHRTVAEDILAKVCSDADAATEAYRSSGRFGSAEVVVQLKLVAAGLPGGEA
nr:putative integron gene cassette protein [uncultured bacterium]